MNPSAGTPARTVLAELGAAGLVIAHEGRQKTWPLDRDPSGALPPEFAARLRAELPAFLGRHAWQSRLPLLCALPATGVSLRRWQVPPTATAELEGVLRLRLESDLPLPPDQLAWGWNVLATGSTTEVLVAALRRDLVRELTALFEACGLEPAFTLAALARYELIDGPPAAARSVLAIGPRQSEWLQADGTGPARLRNVAWGEETLAREIAAITGGSPDTALATWRQNSRESAAGTPLGLALDRAVAALVSSLPGLADAGPLYLTGALARLPAFRAAFSRQLGAPAEVRSLEQDDESSLSATVRGLQRQVHEHLPGLRLRTEEPAPDPRQLLARGTPRRWAIAAALLTLALLALPYGEAFVFGPGLASRVKTIKDRQDQLGLIDREADFLRTLRTDQAPILETLLVLSRTAPPGAKIDSLNLNRQGELSLRLALRQPPEVTDFRSKLADCGFFSSVVVEEQAPTPDRQKINVRLTARVKPPSARGNLKILAPDPAPTTNAAPAPGPGAARPPVPGHP